MRYEHPKLSHGHGTRLSAFVFRMARHFATVGYNDSTQNATMVLKAAYIE